jgi:hypothetical protein
MREERKAYVSTDKKMRDEYLDNVNLLNEIISDVGRLTEGGAHD